MPMHTRFFAHTPTTQRSRQASLILLSLLTVSGVAPSTEAQRVAPANGPVTLDQVLEYADAHSPVLLAARSTRARADAADIAASPRFPSNPEITVYVGPRFGDAGTGVDAQVSLMQEIQIGGERRRRVEASEHFRTMTEAEIEQVRWFVHADIHAAFHRALVERERMRLAERVVAFLYNLMRRFCGDDRVVAEVWFTHQPLAPLEAYRDVFGVTPRFGQAKSGVIVPSVILDVERSGRSAFVRDLARRVAIRTESHVIICGYGRSGQNLARLLALEHIPYMALDLDPDRVRQAAAAGQSVVFGDAARLQSLMAAGLARASAVVVSYHDTASALKILQLVREHAPKVPVIVRTIDDTDLERLRDAGATEVVPEAIEGSLMLASHALALVGVPMRRVLRVVQDQRDARYNMLRGYFHGADDDTPNERDQERMSTVSLPPGAKALGSPLGDLALNAVGVRVVNLRRANGHQATAADDAVLQEGDTLVLSGHPTALALAEDKLLRG